MTTPWEQAWEAGRAAHGPLDVPAAAFAARLRELLTRRLARHGHGAGEVSLAALLARTAAPDVLLATACEADAAGAWEALGRLARSAPPGAAGRGEEVAAAEAGTQRLLDALHGPPRRPGTRTRLGAYDGTASLVGWLAALRRLGERAPSPGTVDAGDGDDDADAALLAGAAEGRLLPPEQAGLAALLERRPDAQAVLADLTAAAAAGALPRLPSGPGAPRPEGAARRTGSPAPARRPGRTRWPLALGLLLACGAAAAGLARRGVFDFEARRQDTERDVYLALRELVRREPGFFAEFQPLSREALEQGEPVVVRRGLTALHPREEVLSTTPRLLWTAVPGATAYTVTVERDGLAHLVRRVAGTELAWPDEAEPLPRETEWDWRVEAEGVPGAVARATFQVAPEQDLVRWNRVVERVGRMVDDAGARDVLLAQMALERGHLAEAYDLIRAHTERWPKDAYAGAVRRYLERRWALGG